MPTAPTSWSIRAPWLIPGDGRIIRDGVLRWRGEIIEAVGPAGQVAPAADHRTLEGVAVLPGLINAHTHLELSHLRGLLPRRASMPRWLMCLLRRRGSDRQMLAAVEAGAREALATGTTALADICHNNAAWQVLQHLPLRKLCFAEVHGMGLLQQGAMDRLNRSLENLPPCDDRLRFGISPHAPYSTSQSVYRDAVALARRLGWPICTHLAETKGERQFLMRGGGKFLQFLQTLSLIDDSFTPPRCKPLEYARQLGLLASKRGTAVPAVCDTGILPVRVEGVPPSCDAGILPASSPFPGLSPCAASSGEAKMASPHAGETPASPCLFAHVNYLDDDELALLAGSGASVVYCPGSSAFFGRSGHRYADMLGAGVNVAIGTDSLASNDSLDMLAEMRRLKRQGQVDNHTILRMATLNGAIALGRQDQIGSLEPGKFADWIAVQLPQINGDCPYLTYLTDVLETILTHPCKVVQTVIGGRIECQAHRGKP